MAAQTEAEVTIAIARDPALVRTVRLVAAAVARRADCPDALIEEIRLAVGEACAVMIGVEEGHERSDGVVEVGICAESALVVTVSGRVDTDDSGFEELGPDPWALLRGLCEEFTVVTEGDLSRLRMTWPV